MDEDWNHLWRVEGLLAVSRPLQYTPRFDLPPREGGKTGRFSPAGAGRLGAGGKHGINDVKYIYFRRCAAARQAMNRLKR
jgi:hypothetical protein